MGCPVLATFRSFSCGAGRRPEGVGESGKSGSNRRGAGFAGSSGSMMKKVSPPVCLPPFRRFGGFFRGAGGQPLSSICSSVTTLCGGGLSGGVGVFLFRPKAYRCICGGMGLLLTLQGPTLSEDSSDVKRRKDENEKYVGLLLAEIETVDFFHSLLGFHDVITVSILSELSLYRTCRMIVLRAGPKSRSWRGNSTSK